MGLFFADGSCGKYITKHGIKYSWAINNLDKDLLKKCKSMFKENELKILDTVLSSGVYKLVPTKTIKSLVTKYRKMFYNKDKYKKLPEEILNATKEIKQSFLDGYFAGDGCRKDKEKI